MREIDFGLEGQFPKDTSYCLYSSKRNELDEGFVALANAVLYAGVNDIFPYADLEGEFQFSKYDSGQFSIAALFEYTSYEFDENGVIKIGLDGNDIPTLEKRVVFTGELIRDPSSFYARILSYPIDTIVPVKEAIHTDKPWYRHNPQRGPHIKGLIVFQDTAARIYTLYGVTPTEVLTGMREVILKTRN